MRASILSCVVLARIVLLWLERAVCTVRGIVHEGTTSVRGQLTFGLVGDGDLIGLPVSRRRGRRVEILQCLVHLRGEADGQLLRRRLPYVR